MPSVRIKENEPFDVALRRFKRSCEKAGILAKVRSCEFYEKPTWERKRKSCCRCKAQPEKSISRITQVYSTLLKPALTPELFFKELNQRAPRGRFLCFWISQNQPFNGAEQLLCQ